MAEELGPIAWFVWRRDKVDDKRRVTAVTRQQAIQLAANGFGIGFEKVDYEVVR